MEIKDKQFTRKPGEMIIHNPDACSTCYLRSIDIIYIDTHDKHQRLAPYGLPTEVRVVPSPKGLVVVLYFDQLENSHIVFVAQIDTKRGAWQNILWDQNFHRNWDKRSIKEAVDNFLMVAEQKISK